MDGKVKNSWRNDVVLCRRETANTFKVGKELNKGKGVCSWNMGAKKAGELWKNCWMLKSFYQKRRRFEYLNEVRKSKRSRSGGWRRDMYRCGGWCRRRKLTLRLWTRASRRENRRDFDRRRRTRGGGRSSADAKLHLGRLLRRRRIYKKLR